MAGEGKGFEEYLRSKVFDERKADFAIKYEVAKGEEYQPNKSRYSAKRDNWLRNFATIPREERTKRQWRTFERYHFQIYGTNEVWGDYD